MKQLVAAHGISVIGLVETKVQARSARRIRDSMLPQWNFVDNNTSLGRVWVAWNPNVVQLVVRGLNDQVIHCSVMLIEDGSWIDVSVVYGQNTVRHRRFMWRSLVAFSNANSLPWVVAGDFNASASYADVGGQARADHTQIQEVQNWLARCDIGDLRRRGLDFTWNNRQRAASFIAKKLDRVLSNEAWITSYSDSFAEFLHPGVSDHSPMIIHMGAAYMRLQLDG